VAAKGAATRQFANDSEAARKDSRYNDAKKSMEKADKTFAKSWKRRENMGKAVDRLAKEEVEQLDEAMLASHIGGSSMIVHHDLADHKERHKKVLSLHKNLTKLGYSTKSKEHLNIAHHEKTKDTVHGSKYDNKDVTYTHPSLIGVFTACTQKDTEHDLCMLRAHTHIGILRTAHGWRLGGP
jgi:hypothetical protein